MHSRYLIIGLYTSYTVVLLYTYTYTYPPPLLAPPSSAVKSTVLFVLPAVLLHSKWSNFIHRLKLSELVMHEAVHLPNCPT